MAHHQCWTTFLLDRNMEPTAPNDEEWCTMPTQEAGVSTAGPEPSAETRGRGGHEPAKTSAPAVPQPAAASLLDFIRCSACGKEPRHAVESRCCGEVWCWECLVKAWPQTCGICSSPSSPDCYKPAKAIEKLMKEVKAAASSSASHQPEPSQHEDVDVYDMLFACPDECGVFLPLDELEDHTSECQADVTCPNGCFAQLKKLEMRVHLADECPLTFVPCGFPCCCDEPVMRCELDDHLVDGIPQHMRHLLARLEAQEAATAELQRKLDQRATGGHRIDLSALVGRVMAALKPVWKEFSRRMPPEAWPPALLALVLIMALFILPLLFMMVLLVQSLPLALTMPVASTLGLGCFLLVAGVCCILE